MTQPAASRSLAQIESLLGIALFHRQANRIFPTSAGMRFIHHARRVLDQLHLAEQDLLSHAPMLREVRVGAIASFSSALLARAAQLVHARMPEVRVRFSTGNIGYLYGQLLAGDIDLMASHAEISLDLDRVQVVPLYEEVTNIVCGLQHPLRSEVHASWEQIASQPWILPPTFTPSRAKLDRVIAVYRTQSPERPPDIEVEAAPVALELLAGSPYLWILAHREAQALQAAGRVAFVQAPETIVRGHMCCMGLRQSAGGSVADLFVRALQDLAA